MDVLSGELAELIFTTTVAGEPVAPTVNTAKATVYTVAGAAIPALTNLAATILPSGVEALITVPGSENVLVGSDPITRFVRFRYQVAGLTYNQMQTYRILPFLPITVTDEYVKNYVLGGAGPDDYDIYAAYVVAKTTVPDLDDDLVGENSIAANRLIALWAGRPSATTLALTFNQREKSHDEEIERYRGIDFGSFVNGIDQEINAITNFLNDVTPLPYAAVELTTPTDPVTGV